MRYDIQMVSPGYGTFAIRFRRDAAKLKAQKLSYGLLESIALLDRPIAHKVMAQIEAWNGKESETFRIDDDRLVILNVSHG